MLKHFLFLLFGVETSHWFSRPCAVACSHGKE